MLVKSEGTGSCATMDLVNKPNCTSSVWMYFGFRSDENGKPRDVDDPVCRLCRKIVRVKGGSTTNMRAHLRSRHRTEYELTLMSPTGSQAPGFDFSQEDFMEDFPALQTTSSQTGPNQNYIYIPDAVLPPGEPWLQGGPSRAMVSVPSCLRLWTDPGPCGAAGAGDTDEEQSGGMKVYAKYHLQQGLMFGPFVGEIIRGQLHTSLKNAWAIRDEAAFYYVDASDESKSNWMRFVTYASGDEEHNLTVFQFYRQIYYRVSQAIPEGAELKVSIGKDYAAMLGLGMGENLRCDVGDKEMVLRILQDIQVVTLPEAGGSSHWSDNSQSQSPMPVISEVTSMSHADAAADSAPASAPVSSSSSLPPFPTSASHQMERYDFIPGAEKLVSHPNGARKGVWYFFGFEPDPTGQPLDRRKVVCKLCGEPVSCAGGAAEIQNHLTSKHHIKPRDVVKDMRERSFMPGQKSQGPFFSSCGDMAAMFSLKPGGPLPQIMTSQTSDAIVNFLIRDLHPPALVEGEGFRQLIHTLLPSYRELPSACVLEGLLRDLHSKGRRSLVQLLRRKMGSADDEEYASDYTAPIDFDYTSPRRRGRPPREVPHFVTLSVDVWFHDWQGDTERYATLWVHYVDAGFNYQNLALTTRRLVETGAGDCNLKTIEAQVKAMAHEWGISQYNLVLLGGEGSEKLRSGLKRRERSGEPVGGSGPHPNSTTFLEREDSVSSDELTGLEHAHSSSEGFPSISCFLTAAQGCVEELMSHPVISKTLGQFQRVLSTLFPLHYQHKGLSQQSIQNMALTMSRQEQVQLKSWAHSRPSWNTLYGLLSTLLKHQNLVCDMIKEIRGETPTRGDASDPAASESNAAENSSRDSAPNMSSSAGTIVVPRRSEWKVLEELWSVLKPLDVACRTLAKEAFPRLSLIKPILTGLLSRHLVSRPGETSAILKEVKRMMRRSLASCYDNPIVNRVLCVACSLDPQFHGLGFMELKEQTATFDWLKKEAVRIVKEDKRRSQAGRRSEHKRDSSPMDPDSDCLRRSKRLKETAPINFKEAEDEEDDDSDAEEGESESADPSVQGGLSGMEFLLGDLFGSAPQSRQSSVEESVDMEMSVFRADKGASLGVDSLQWWRTKSGQLPLLAKVARAYLAAPAVAGTAAQAYLQEGGGATYKKRANIPPECLDEILFLHHNCIPATILGPAIKKDEKI